MLASARLQLALLMITLPATCAFAGAAELKTPADNTAVDKISLDSKDGAKLLSYAYELYERKQFDKALKYFIRAQAHSTLEYGVGAKIAQAQCLAKLGDISSALTILSDVQLKQPLEDSGSIAKIDMLQANGQFVEALNACSFLEENCAYGPEKGCLKRSEVLQKMGRTRLAIEEAERAYYHCKHLRQPTVAAEERLKALGVTNPPYVVNRQGNDIVFAVIRKLSLLDFTNGWKELEKIFERKFECTTRQNIYHMEAYPKRGMFRNIQLQQNLGTNSTTMFALVDTDLSSITEQDVVSKFGNKFKNSGTGDGQGHVYRRAITYEYDFGSCEFDFAPADSNCLDLFQIVWKSPPAKPISSEDEEASMRSSDFEFLKYGTDCCDRADSNHWSTYFQDENLDILARAGRELALRAARDLPAHCYEVLNHFALDALLLNDSVGNYAKGDAYAKLIQPELEFKIDPNEMYDRSCFAAIDKDDQDGAIKIANKLLLDYQKEGLQRKGYGNSGLKLPNLFSTILSIARKFSDHSWFAASNTLLQNLATASLAKHDWLVGNNLITTELIVNAERAKVDSEPFWAKLDAELRYFNNDYPTSHGLPSSTRVNFHSAEKLRRLAIAYYYAGEVERADILISRALKTPVPSPYQEAPDDPPPKIVLLHSANEPDGVAHCTHVGATCRRGSHSWQRQGCPGNIPAGVRYIQTSIT